MNQNFPDFRRRLRPAVRRHPQLPLQAWPSPGPALHLPGQARLGAVLLQGRPKGGQRADAQEPTGLHHHEPHRSQSGAAHSSGENRLPNQLVC